MNFPNKPKGIKRIMLATANSARAFNWLTKNETAFQQELLISAILVTVTFFLEVTFAEQLILWCALLFVLFTEALNTAIEAVVDRIGIEHHSLSGLAKDIGSLAVSFSLIIAALIWLAVLLD